MKVLPENQTANHLIVIKIKNFFFIWTNEDLIINLILKEAPVNLSKTADKKIRGIFDDVWKIFNCFSTISKFNTP